MEGWQAWRQRFQTEAPVTFFIVERILDRVQDIVFFPADVYRNVMWYMRNRFGDAVHYLHTDTPAGGWRVVDERILHGCFNALVDCVEIEKSHMERVFGDGRGVFFRKNPWNLFQTPRSPEAGLRYLDWEISLKDGRKRTQQARDAAEVKKLYQWWTHERPNRIDPYVGIDSTWGRDLTSSQREHLRVAVELETKYYEEDTRMLVCLMKIRGSLWT